MQPAAAPIHITDWAGLVSNRGKFPAKPSEASVQTNLRVVKRGELSLRKNAEEVDFTIETGDSPSVGVTFISFAPYQNGGVAFLITQTTGGVVEALRLA